MEAQVSFQLSKQRLAMARKKRRIDDDSKMLPDLEKVINKDRAGLVCEMCY